MSKAILNWGFLSTARINRALVNPLQKSKTNRLLAVASRDLERAAAYARERNIPRAYGSYEALLADPEIDVIYNPLPNSLHVEWTIKAVQAGKHVLCEKPLAMSPEEVDAIAVAAAQARRVVTEAFMYRHHPQTLKVQELVQGGALGALRMIKGAFTYTQKRPADVRLEPQLGGGAIWDVGCYPISYARLLAGCEPVRLFGSRVTGPTGVDLSFCGQLEFPGGLVAQFDCSFEAPYRAYMEIVGTQGSLWVSSPFKVDRRTTLLLTRDSGVEKIAVRAADLYTYEVDDIASAILHGTPPRISLADSRGNAAAICALIRSAGIDQ